MPHPPEPDLGVAAPRLRNPDGSTYQASQGIVGRLNPDGSVDTAFGDNGIAAVAPTHAEGSAFWSRYLGEAGASPLRDWPFTAPKIPPK